ncbi:septum formation initiator family protein [Streptomyces sp. NPDC002004]
MARKPELRGRAARLARLLPSGSSRAARTPFVLLVVALLGGGLIGLLILNSSLNEGSFQLSELKKQTTELTDEQQELQRAVDSYSEPGALERRARELGMVPGGDPVFLNPDGTVRGVPHAAAPSALGPADPHLVPPEVLQLAPRPALSPARPSAAGTPFGTAPAKPRPDRPVRPERTSTKPAPTTSGR